MRMRNSGWLLAAAVALTGALSHLAQAADPPQWMFPDPAPPAPLPPDDGKVRTLPGSSKQFTLTEIRNFYAPPDWYPEDHAAMPDLVAHGVNPGVFACGYCHLPTGNGRPENANIAGLPAQYIVNQVKDMASGVRASSVPHHFPQTLMLKLAPQAAADPGLAQAAEYFAATKPRHVTKVVETDTIPKVGIHRWMYFADPGGGTEPLGDRLIELADNHNDFELRDGRMTYTVYVPKGSLAKGEALVVDGGDGKTFPCATCHGAGLKGVDLIPPIAGRSPNYLARQLFDIKSGARHGAAAAPMMPVVEQLTNADIIAITAYLSTLDP